MRRYAILLMSSEPRLYTCFAFNQYICLLCLKSCVANFKTYEHNRLDETSVVDKHRCHMAAKFGVLVNEDHSKLPTLYWLPKLHKRPYKS